MVQDHSDSERGNPLPPYGLLFPISSMGSFMKKGHVLFNDTLNTFYLRLYAIRVLLYAPSHRQDNTYQGICDTSRGALAGTRNYSMTETQQLLINKPI